MEVYTKRATMSLIKEVTAGTALTPTTFVRFNDEDITTEYSFAPLAPVAGNRSKLLGGVDGVIASPIGTINLNVEPKTFGHFLRSLYGTLLSGIYMPLSAKSGAYTVGETVGNGSLTATVVADGKDYILISAPTGVFAAGDTITGVTSAKTGTLVAYAATVYGHKGNLPSTSLTYTLQFNYVDSAIRYYGVYFNAIDALSQSDNVLSASLKVMALGQFRHGRVTAITTAGATKTITVDQTKGLVAADIIKIYRPSTGAFIDLNGSSVKTEAISSVTDGTNFVLATLTDATAVGDLVMLAPQTATYTVVKEIPFVGGAQMSIGQTIDTVAAYNIEEFNLTIENEMEARHAAQGTGVAARFPSTILQKGVSASGNWKIYYTDEKYQSYMRDNDALALRFKAQGALLGSTAIRSELRFELPEIMLKNYNTSISNDALIEESVPFEGVYNTTEAILGNCLLVNEITSY